MPTTVTQYEKWKIEVTVLPATDGGWAQSTIIVSRSDGGHDDDIPVSPSGVAFETEQDAVADGVKRAKVWIDHHS